VKFWKSGARVGRLPLMMATCISICQEAMMSDLVVDFSDERRFEHSLRFTVYTNGKDRGEGFTTVQVPACTCA
jgi:hypothetical protein